MPLNRIGETNTTQANPDKFNVLAKDKGDQVVIFVVDGAPSRVNTTIENTLDDHNSIYEKVESKDDMKCKYIVRKLDPKTFY